MLDLTILTLKHIKCEIAGSALFESEKLTIEKGDVIGLIGKNGAGKTCLLKSLANQFQGVSAEKIGTPSVKFNELELTDIMEKSGGELAISNFLASLREPADLFLLDEPTTYLDEKNFLKVVHWIKRSPAAFCIASHDRRFLKEVATKIWVIEQGKIKEYSCSFSEYLQEREYEISQYQTDIKKYQKEKKRIKETLQTMKQKKAQKNGKPKKMSASDYRVVGVKTQMNVKQKKLQKSIRQQENKLDSLQKPEKIEEQFDITFLSTFSVLPKRQLLIPAHEAKIEQKTLWKIPAMTLQSGEKLGIRGKNGAGKTTYLGYILSILPKYYRVGYFKQNQLNFEDEEVSVYHFILEKADERLEESQIRTLLALLDFKGEKVFRQIKQLSKGERVKVSLLSLLVSDLDILLLDELTNYLDMKTLEAVENVLMSYPGILIFVSHDDYFIKNLADKVLNIDDMK